ncbi:MAG: hypothetical protein U0704_12040 [Candidatus Eisenbacteria bacterium]
MPRYRLLFGFASFLLLVLSGAARAQGVGINATGAVADTSAILDLSATNKGFLPPRMTAAQRAAIVQPATGLLVYQTDGAAGLWYNAGTNVAPNWKQVMDASTGTGPWSLSGTSAYYSGGRVGIGTSGPTHRLMVLDDNLGLRVQTNAAGSALASFGGFGSFTVDAPGVIGGRLTLLENGNLGLGATTPGSRLSFGATLGKKISLYPSATSDYGFGVSSGRLQIFSDGLSGGDVAIGTDAAGTFTERFAVKNNGALAVAGSTGAAGQVLQSNGSSTPPTWVSPTQATYNNTYSITSTAVTTVPIWSGQALPDLTKAITVTGNAKLVIDYTLTVSDPSCALCAGAPASSELWLDGTKIRGSTLALGNGEGATLHDHHVVTVGPGTHTVQVYGHSNAKADIFGNSSTLYGNTLSIEVIPQ